MLNASETSIARPRNILAGDTPSVVQFVELNSSGECGWQIRLYYPSGSALSIGSVVKIAYTGQSSGDPQCIACVSGSAAYDRVVVAVNATASGNWDWFWIEGICNALVEGTTDVAVGDYLLVDISTAAGSFSKDGAALTANSAAIAMAAQAANSSVLAKVRLLGERVTIQQ